MPFESKVSREKGMSSIVTSTQKGNSSKDIQKLCNTVTDELGDTLDDITTQSLFLGVKKESSVSNKVILRNVGDHYIDNSELVDVKEGPIPSQFFDDSQVMGQIEYALDSINQGSSSENEERNSYGKRKKEDDHDSNEELFKIPKLVEASTSNKESVLKKYNRTLSELLNQSDMDVIFDEIENSIYQMGTSQEILSSTHDNVLEMLCESEKELQEGDKSLLNISSSNLSFSSIFKSKLLANASKSVTVGKAETSNLSFSEEAVEFQELGPFYGLPTKVKDLIKLYKGIDELYDWQDECLNLPAIHQKKNLIYALPTSGGKTLVAEILILRELLCFKKNAIFILPFVAIVQEKVWTLSPFAVALDFLVEEYAGSKGVYPPRKRRRKNSIFIATIEKALGLINSLIETGRLNEIGLIVVDELHLLGEPGRGPTLEALLTKLAVINAKVQIIGMSATIGNLEDICTFLNAEAYTKNFRPVELTEYVKCDAEIAKIDLAADEDELLKVERTVDFKYAPAIKALDPDQLGGLVMEVIPKGSCLIFCASKKNCENVAKLLSRILFKSLKTHKTEEKEVLLEALKAETGSLCETLKFSIPYGIAYHHSGLTTEERRLIEDGFRAGAISVICCTSTLAAGVNLPAKRVILRSPYIGRDFMNLSRYKQMIGRAGRAGLGEKGDSILICTQRDLPKVIALLKSPMDKSMSSIHENEGKGLRHLLLSCIALGIANTRSELQAVTNKTLWAVQNKNQAEHKKLTDKIIKNLFTLGALQTNNPSLNIERVASNVSLKLETTINSEENIESQDTNKSKKKHLLIQKNTKLVISKLGIAAIKGGLELSKAHILYEDLVQAQYSLVLLDVLHLLYLVTPYDLSEHIKPDMNSYFTMFQQLPPKELHTAKVLGITESVAVKMMSNQPIKTVSERVLNRFYLTLMLYDLWNEMPVFEAAEKYGVDRGLVQNLMQSSASFSSNVMSFCQELEEFWPFAHLLKGMSMRLSHCCTRELMPLMELPAVKQSRAKQLFNAGYKTLHSIAKANVEDLIRDIEYLNRRVAVQLISAAKMLLLEKVENLREEAEDVLNGVSEGYQHNQFNMSLPR
ncbi:helicase POLQ-like [Coccinella septempunctata]|uniref:helicase POLQ-like n=1 Tax=Coccinella septempunctata TaxID=41139 RepID=UPI001D07E353|nr:helicase POLQ-like [Coccinella septempunctata]